MLAGGAQERAPRAVRDRFGGGFGVVAGCAGVIGAFLTSIYVLRVAKQIFWGKKSDDPHFQHLPDAQGTEWAALGILVFVLVLFGVAPGLALRPVDTATVPLLQRVVPVTEAAGPKGPALPLR